MADQLLLGLKFLEKNMGGDLGDIFKTAISTDSDWFPLYDMVETQSGITIHCCLPGVKKNNTHIDFKLDTLTIHGKSSLHKPDSSIIKHEIPYGAFKRTINLPFIVLNRNSILTELEGGILRIIIAKPNDIEASTFTINLD
jgi:HSP20 family molecular chaperone IbpA